MSSTADSSIANSSTAGAIKVAAVVVTYQPDLDSLKCNLLALMGQVWKIILVDNGSSNQVQIDTSMAELAEQKDHLTSIEFVLLEQNVGLGAAHNLGIEKLIADSTEYTHVLILDQDSMVADNMVSQLAGAWEQLDGQVKLAAVGGCYVDKQQGSQSFFVRFGRLKFRRSYCESESCAPIKADFLISSGSLFSLDVLKQVGLMDEALFIDHVDTEWFLRAGAQGYEFYGVCQAKMTHSLGEKLHRVKLIRERFVPQHKPFRYYYIMRNSILLYRKPHANRRWIWNDLQRLLMIFLMYGFLVGPRVSHLKMMWRGVLDGARGVTGRLKDA
jgi:rhamnosyltransferase